MTNRNAESMGTYGSTWEARGYSGQGNVTDLIGSLAGRSAIVVGSADGCFDELQAAEAKLGDPVILAVNSVGMFLPRVDHWVSLHADHLGAWKQVRWLHPREKEAALYHSCTARPFIDYVWECLTPCFALSGYYAMQVAYIMGAELIVLAGCPGESKRHFFEARPRQDFGYGSGLHGSESGIREQLEREMRRVPDFKARVRSMSGYTQDVFGGLD